jgi:hypothetical protein
MGSQGNSGSAFFQWNPFSQPFQSRINPQQQFGGIGACPFAKELSASSPDELSSLDK